MNQHYSYIVIEGNIGAGKTSLSTMLSKEYQSTLILEQFEGNSFLPKFYQDKDKYAFPLELSFLAERYQQLKNILQFGDLFHSVKIADYFIDKSLIFARKTLQQDEFHLFRKLFTIIVSQLPQPDLLVYLYKKPFHLKQNIILRGREYEQNITEDYLSQIQESYIEYLHNHYKNVVLIIDTTRIDFVHNEKDYIEIKQIIESEYPKGIHKIIL
jgi:deoxyguanosine kinase